MRRAASTTALCSLMLLSCAPRGNGTEGTTPGSGGGEAGGASAPPADPLAAELGADRLSLAPSPLTPLATDLSRLALAALRGRQLPDVGIPLEPIDPQDQQVEYRHLDPPVPPLEVIAVGFVEVEAQLQGGEAGGVELSLLLTERGVRLVGVDGSSAESCPLPRALAPLAAAAEEVVAALREGRAGPMLLGVQECLETFASPELCEELAEELPDAEDLAEAPAALGNAQVVGLEPDEVILVARTAQGQIVGLVMELDCEDQGVVIETNELVRAQGLREQ